MTQETTELERIALAEIRSLNLPSSWWKVTRSRRGKKVVLEVLSPSLEVHEFDLSTRTIGNEEAKAELYDMLAGLRRKAA